MPPGNRRSRAAQHRENTKQGILGIKEAHEVDADPTYCDDSALHNDTLECIVYPNSPSLPVYHIEISPTALPSSLTDLRINNQPCSKNPNAQRDQEDLTQDGSITTLLTADVDLVPDCDTYEVCFL